MSRALMFQGTGSDVGKTVLVAGLCRAATRRGLAVRPFKPQNMSNNAAVAKSASGEGEIGRGQWLQALACGIEPNVHMNPVLLKPQSQIGSQIVVQGQVRGNAKAHEYLALKPKLLESVLESFEILAAESDLVLVEGAGSPAEINLRAGDIANMGFATAADIPVILIGDIDRGGVIASIVGTHTILPDVDREAISGFLINKFRGDISLFDDGLSAIRKFTSWPSFGVLPWVDAVRRLPAEDSVALDKLVSGQKAAFHVVVPALGKIANFDDLDPLVSEPGASVQFLRKGDSFPRDVDLVVLPGSKSTISDMIELRSNGWEEPIRTHAALGGAVLGICGGYQMLGRSIQDPLGLEGDVRQVDGLDLLDIETVLQPEKTVRTSDPVSVEFNLPLSGYEIHMGETTGPDCERPVIDFGDHMDGATSADGKIAGCYLHGIFSSDLFRRQYLKKLGFSSDANHEFQKSMDSALDELAEAMEEHLDVEGLLSIARQIRL